MSSNRNGNGEVNKGGRPTKFTPELQERITSKLREGLYVETVCDLVGIHKDTFYAWREQGEIDSIAGHVTNLSKFSDATTRAMADAVDEMNALWVAACKGPVPYDWRAISMWLERRKPKLYGKRVAVTGGDGGAVEVSVTRDKLLERIASPVAIANGNGKAKAP